MKIEQSIEDMVKKPLTPQQIADYKDRLNQADKYGKKLFKIWTLIILISLGLIALFFQYSGMSLGFLRFCRKVTKRLELAIFIDRLCRQTVEGLC